MGINVLKKISRFNFEAITRTGIKEADYRTLDAGVHPHLQSFVVVVLIEKKK